MEKLTLKKPEPRVLSSLYECVDIEYSWRISEVSNFNSIVKSTEKGPKQNALIRAGITLLYAHWEGFVKAIAYDYYQFVAYQKHKVKELINSFIGIIIKGELETYSSTKKITVQNKIIDLILVETNKTANFPSSNPIKTSNLSYEIFEDTCELIGFSITDFEARFKAQGKNDNVEKLINKQLLEYRNTIAHGQYLQVDLNDFQNLYNNVMSNGLLYCFKELLLNAAQDESYLK